MSRQLWEELLGTDQSANATQILNTVTETIIFPDFTVPAFFMNDGRVLRYMAYGTFSNVVTTPGTLTFAMYMGGLAGTKIATTAAISLNIIAQTNDMWMLTADIISRGNGTASPILTVGLVTLGAQLAASNNQPNFMGSAGATAPSTVNVDTTQNQSLSLSAKFSVSTATTQLTGLHRTIEALN